MAGEAPQAVTNTPRQLVYPKKSIRLQLLAVVNCALAIFVVLFLAFDYRRDLVERLEEKHISLEEEAKTLLPAVLQMQHHGHNSVQQYLDAVCGQMQETHSPGHHIAVNIGEMSFQALAHHRASPGMLRAMEQAANSASHRARFEQTELLVGAHEREGTAVYVAETMENLYQSVIADVLLRLLGFIGLSFVAAVVVNIALTRIVTRPLNTLVATVQRIGEGSLGIKADSFGSAELNYLAKEINSMSESLGATEQARRAQMARARGIQQNLLPQTLDLLGLNIAHLFEPADEVGGDYYDVLRLPDGSSLFCIADVTGHGVPAAMSAAMLKALLIQAADRFTSPAAILKFINDQLIAINPAGDFVSMAISRLTRQTLTLEYASAGHEPTILLSPTGETRNLPSTGTLLGILEDATWEEVTLELTSRNRLLMVTDGVSESRNARSELFGRQRLTEFLARHSRQPLELVTAGLREELTEFRNTEPQYDDVTVVLIEVTTLPSGA